jgi:hypothetical protein
VKNTKVILREVEVVDDILCNKCGESTRSCLWEGDINNLPIYEFEGLTEVEIVGGYGSKHIGDGNKLVFSLCEKCLMEFAKTFAIDAFVECEW